MWRSGPAASPLILASATVLSGLVFALASCQLDSTGSTLTTSAGTDAASSSGDGTTTSSSSDVTTSSSGTGGAGAPVTPSCLDGVLNGDESDVDCGGDACTPCGIHFECGGHGDCASLTCAAGVCSAFVAPACPPSPDPARPTCADCILDGVETDVDCGGDACGPCAEGKACGSDADCASGNCDALVCAPPGVPSCDAVDPDNPTCNDCVLNGGESDVDCGGDACGPCASSDTCTVDADCASGACTLFLCQ